MKKSLKLSRVFHSKNGTTQKNIWDRNQSALAALHDGTIRRITAVDAFNEGVNVPSIGLVAFCRVTESIRIFYQQMGRGLRRGKEKLIILDFVGSLERIQDIMQIMNRVADLHEQFSSKEEREREGYERKKFEVSGAGFEFTFSNKIVDLMEVLEHCRTEFYSTWEEASEAARKFGVKLSSEYFTRYKEDPGLPRQPDEVYSDFPGWRVFLGTTWNFYKTWQEASAKVISRELVTKTLYKRGYHEDPNLPCCPEAIYPDFPGWPMFCGRKKAKKKYGTWQIASMHAIKLGFKTVREYFDGNKQDLKLPADPNSSYPNFPGWGIFLGTGKIKVKNPYKTCDQASRAAILLGVTKKIEYPKLRKADPRLPGRPEDYPDWPGWQKFLGKIIV